MSADALLARLDAVKPTGDGRWIARCPAHADRHASLSVKETAEGVVLVKCWAGCSAAEIVSAAGLDMGDLFPEKSTDGKPERRPFPAADILRGLHLEAMIVAVAASDMAKGKRITPDDLERLKLAASRIHAAAEEFQ